MRSVSHPSNKWEIKNLKHKHAHTLYSDEINHIRPYSNCVLFAYVRHGATKWMFFFSFSAYQYLYEYYRLTIQSQSYKFVALHIFYAQIRFRSVLITDIKRVPRYGFLDDGGGGCIKMKSFNAYAYDRIYTLTKNCSLLMLPMSIWDQLFIWQ